MLDISNVVDIIWQRISGIINISGMVGTMRKCVVGLIDIRKNRCGVIQHRKRGASLK